jgi:hypothetical protein
MEEIWEGQTWKNNQEVKGRSSGRQMNEGILRREGEILLGVSRRIKDERELFY